MIEITVILILLSIWVLIGAVLFVLKPEPEDKPVMRITPMVTPTNPAFVNENSVGQGDSVIVEPKTPQRLAFEEQEELRKLNITPR